MLLLCGLPPVVYVLRDALLHSHLPTGDCFPPEPTCPSEVRESTDTATGTIAVTWSAVTATDDYDASPAVVCVPASGAQFPVDTTTLVNCTATDAAGNEDFCTFNVVVGM